MAAQHNSDEPVPYGSSGRLASLDGMVIVRHRVGRLIYRVYSLSPPGQSGEPLGYARPSMSGWLGRQHRITLFTDESRRTELLRVEQRRSFRGPRILDVLEPGGQVLGAVRRDGRRRRGPRTWTVLDVRDRVLATADESDARPRRPGELPPHVFDLHGPDGRRMASLTQRRDGVFGLALVLDLSGDRLRVLDRRLSLALVITRDLLDTVDEEMSSG